MSTSYRMSQINTHRPPVSRHSGAVTGNRPFVGTRGRVAGVRNGLARNAFKRPSIIGTLNQAITNPNAGRNFSVNKNPNRLPSKLPSPIDENDGAHSVASYDDDSDDSHSRSRSASVDNAKPSISPSTPSTSSTSAGTPTRTSSTSAGTPNTSRSANKDSTGSSSTTSSPLSSPEDDESDSPNSKKSQLALSETGEKDGESHQRQNSLSTRSHRRSKDSVSMIKGSDPLNAQKNPDEHDDMSTTTRSADTVAHTSNALKSASISGNPLDNITHKSEPAMSTVGSRPSLFNNGGASLLSLAKPADNGRLVTRSLSRDRGSHHNFKMHGSSPVFGHRSTSSRSSSRGSLASPSGARRGGPMSSQYNTFGKHENEFDEAHPHFDEFLSVDPPDRDDDAASMYTTPIDDELFSLDNCDFAGLAENHQFRSELRKLNAGFEILFSNMGDKINRKRKMQQRWFAVTDAAIINYTVQPSKINRVIPFEEISSISRSEDCEWFVVHHLSRESDYLIRCHQFKKCIAIVAHRYQEVMLKPLEILVGNEFLVFQKGKKALSVRVIKKQQVNGLSYKTTNLVWKDRPTSLYIEMMLPRYQPPVTPSVSRGTGSRTTGGGGGSTRGMFSFGSLDQPAGGGPGSTLFSYPSAADTTHEAPEPESPRDVEESTSNASSSMAVPQAPQPPSKPRMSKMERLLGNDGASASSNLGGGSIGALGRSAASPTFAPLVLPEDAAAAKKPRQPKPTRKLFGSLQRDKNDGSSRHPRRQSRSASNPSTSYGTRKKSLASSLFSLNKDKDEDYGVPARPASAGASQRYNPSSPSLSRRGKWGGSPASANLDHRRSLPNVRQSPASAGSSRKSPFGGDPYVASPPNMPRSKSIGSSTLPTTGARRGPGSTLFGGNSMSSASSTSGGSASSLFNPSPASTSSSPLTSVHKSPLTGNVKVRDAASSEMYGVTSTMPDRPRGASGGMGMGGMAFRYVTNNAILEEHHKRHKSLSRNSDSNPAGGGLGSGGMLQGGSRVPGKGDRGPFGQLAASSISLSKDARSPRKSSLGLSTEKPPATTSGASENSTPVSKSPPSSFVRPRLGRPISMPHHPASKIKSPSGRGAHSSKSSQSSISSFSSSSSSIDVNSDSDFGPGPIKRPSLMQAARRVGKAHQ